MAAQLTDIWQARLFVAHTLEPVEDRQEAELARRLPLCRQPEANETAVAQRLPDDLAREDILGAVHTAK